MLYSKFFKRFLDLTMSLVLFVVTLPIFIIFTVLLGFANKGNPFFLQKRPGLHSRIFTIIKFKTMNDRADESGNLLPDNQRLTSVGKFIRKTSLDELPQLLNVITGNMSFVGPRPLLIEYLPLYTGEQKRRHDVRPGITGWAQVNGRNAIGWERKFELDNWYVRNISLSLDLKIFFLTLKRVFAARDISSPNHATMEKFRGSKLNTG